MGRGKLIAIIAAIIVVALVLLQVVLYLATLTMDTAVASRSRVRNLKRLATHCHPTLTALRLSPYRPAQPSLSRVCRITSSSP